jgi:hypothetical protein
MPSNLRTVLRDSYVGHVMCAAFLVSAIHSIGRAIDHPFENTVTNLLHDLGVGSTSQSSELGVLLTIEFVNAVAGILLALIFWRWLFRAERGNLNDGTYQDSTDH